MKLPPVVQPVVADHSPGRDLLADVRRDEWERGHDLEHQEGSSALDPDLIADFRTLTRWTTGQSQVLHLRCRLPEHGARFSTRRPEGRRRPAAALETKSSDARAPRRDYRRHPRVQRPVVAGASWHPQPGAP